MKTLKHFAILALVAAASLTPAAALAQDHGVVDKLGLFSPEAKAKADRRIAELERVEGRDLLIETLPPPPKPANLDVKDHEAVKKFFDRYALERFEAKGVDGVYVMIMTKPEHILRVAVGNNTQSKGYFTAANRDELIALLRTEMKNDPNVALVKAVNYVVDTMERNHPTRGAVQGAARGGFPWGTVLTIGAVILGIWVVFALVRAMFSGGGAMGGGGGYAPGYGGGGGFMQNFLGGMLGAAAGMWAYNTFFGGGTSSAWGAGGGDMGSSTLDKDPDTSATVGGDTWGNDGGNADGGNADVGGGDWGAEAGGADAGGDWGGGDAGGGDWGGGGDMGGGGGDW